MTHATPHDVAPLSEAAHRLTAGSDVHPFLPIPRVQAEAFVAALDDLLDARETLRRLGGLDRTDVARAEDALIEVLAGKAAQS